MRQQGGVVVKDRHFFVLTYEHVYPGVILNFYVHHGQLEGMTTPKNTAFALSLIGATTSFVSGFFAPLVRVLEANWGFRRTILLGLCLISCGLVASGWAHQVSIIYRK